MSVIDCCIAMGARPAIILSALSTAFGFMGEPEYLNVQALVLNWQIKTLISQRNAMESTWYKGQTFPKIIRNSNIFNTFEF